MVGSATAWFGLAAPITICVFSIFNRPPCHSIPFIVAFGFQLGTAIILLHLNSSDYDYITLFIISIIWGAGSGLWPYCLAALSATVLHQHLETAFSNYYLFHTLGAALNILGHRLCTEMKIYILIAILSVGFIGYALVDILYYLRHKRNANP